MTFITHGFRVSVVLYTITRMRRSHTYTLLIQVWLSLLKVFQQICCNLSFQIYERAKWSTPKIMYFISSLILLRFFPSDLPVVLMILREKKNTVNKLYTKMYYYIFFFFRCRSILTPYDPVYLRSIFWMVTD
jgi:hypothetical protein